MKNDKQENPSSDGSKDLKSEVREKFLKALRQNLIPFRDVNNPWATYVEIKSFGGRPSMCVEADSEDLVLFIRKELSITAVSAPEVIRQMIQRLQDEARFGTNERPVAIRTGAAGDAWYFSLGTKDRKVVKISDDGWSVVEDCPVQFVQTKFTRPMPLPDPSGTLDDLKPFIRLRPEDMPLFQAWLLMCFTPTGPYPIAAAVGEHGSGKTLLEHFCSRLVDPSDESIRSVPRNEEGLLELAGRRWMLTFDNLSEVTRSVSDNLCRMSTGTGGQSSGTGDSCLRRPMMLTTIDDLRLENDLLDRVVWMVVPRLRDENRKSESELWNDFNKAYEKILGGIFNALVEVRKRLPAVRTSDLPRMADYARVGMAAESLLGLNEGDFLKRYQSNRDSVAWLALESNAIGSAIRKLMIQTKTWSGTAQKFVEHVQKYFPVEARQASGDLTSPRKLSGVIRRLAPSLRRLGCDIEFERSAERRLITITRTRDLTDEERDEKAMIPPISDDEQKDTESLYDRLKKLGQQSHSTNDGDDDSDGVKSSSVATPSVSTAASDAIKTDQVTKDTGRDVKSAKKSRADAA